MFNINTFNISNLNKNHDNNALNSNWLEYTKVDKNIGLCEQYANICNQHRQEKKWLLFINPEESSIEKLAKQHGVDVSKILMVNDRVTANTQTKIKIEQIKSVLTRGNCSAVIVSNADFKNEEISQLESSAQQGQTQCVLLKKQPLH